MAFEICGVEEVIRNEIMHGLNQTQIAQTYALAIRGSGTATDWKIVNKMIVDRWSMSGLNRIKEMAWSGSCFPSD